MSFNRHRVSSVSFTRSHTLSEPNHASDLPSDDDDNIQISLAPHIQTYLAKASQRHGCIGRCLPIPFERAARRSWCNPHFDSDILEGQYKTSAFPQLRLRFRYALLYILLVSLTWFIYFLSYGLVGMATNYKILCCILAGLVFLVLGLLFLTHTNFFRTHFLLVSLCLSIILYSLSLYFEYSADISPVGHFSLCVEILLLIYTVIPIPLYVCVITGLFYSIIFEVITLILHDYMQYHVFVRFISHLCVHLIGLHILIMTNVRMRGTFMKVGQSLLVRRQLEMEKQLKEKMIHSVMPPKLADWLMNNDDDFVKNAEHRTSNPETMYFKSLFRPFNMHRMENVSILFADIVGFTKMSSNKTAEELVAILNDLFERFDHLCSLHECEKISTLGDCYYCVSGCPEPRQDHAKCCVEMGLGMIQAIKQFDVERNEGVNMRVGVHTGTVLCGIVGTRRFKFDVWSNDVTLANRMESTGKPGMVHISEKTQEFLPDHYALDEGEPVFGYKTYFIVGRKSDRHSSFNGSLRPTSSQKFESLQLIISPPTSPPSVSPITRPRVLSCNDSNLKAHYNPNQLSPNMFKMKANSLPSILDSDCEDIEQDETSNIEESSVKSPTSIQSCGKNYNNKVKKWKIPKFLRKQNVDVVNVEDSNNVNESSSNGYQQVPAIVETNCCKPENDILKSDSSWSSFARQISENKENLGFDETKADIIDIRSYISQSRSDIGQYDYSPSELSHFIRSGSYKSARIPNDLLRLDKSPNDIMRLDRSPNDIRLDRSGSNRSHTGRSFNYEVSPLSRARSATMAARVDMDCLDVPSAGYSNLENHVSECASVNSRKDSGIRSNSRRSSIQQQIYAMNQSNLPQEDLLQARVSGYYTSSQSTIASVSPQYGSQLPAPFCDQLGHRFQKLRKQSDLQLIRCVQDNFKSKHSYFMKPPLSNITLFFKSSEMEREYRKNVHTISDRPGEMIPTLATSRYNTYFDILISAIIFSTVVTSLFLLYVPTVYSLVIFLISLCIQLFAVVLCIRQIIHFTKDIFYFFSEWYRWHFFGAFIVSLPIVIVLSNFSCLTISLETKQLEVSDYFYCYLFFVGVIHFCNFTQFNCWMKNSLATIFAIIFLCLITLIANGCVQQENTYSNVTNFTSPYHQISPIVPVNNEVSPFLAVNYSNISEILIIKNTSNNDAIHLHNINLPLNTSNPFFRNNNSSTSHQKSKTIYLEKHQLYQSEIFIDVILLLVLVWFLNREFEIGYRLSFHANLVANRDKVHVQSLKNQADWLLHNIIPKHVADQLKKSAKYSENHKNVGIIFASIVNFNEMYDESYLGGKEYLRVLNELIADFDELLNLTEFKSVEKIKTIGSTFMAASGLNPEVRRDSHDPYQHLYALMDFAIAMQKVVDNFNRDLLEFNLILRVGYNFGDVTAGVIGTSKLYYDIWGDAVNIASRMDSTGVNGRIQIGGACLEILEKRYEFEPRGSVYVKGKDNMNVYLLLKKKDEIDDD